MSTTQLRAICRRTRDSNARLTPTVTVRKSTVEHLPTIQAPPIALPGKQRSCTPCHLGPRNDAAGGYLQHPKVAASPAAVAKRGGGGGRNTAGSASLSSQGEQTGARLSNPCGVQCSPSTGTTFRNRHSLAARDCCRIKDWWAQRCPCNGQSG